MKIVLANLGSVSRGIKAEASWPPLGMLYLGTLLKNRSHEVYLLDQAAEELPERKTIDWILKKDPEIVGFSTLTSNGAFASRMAKVLKNENPDIKIVLGGVHASFNDMRILKKYPPIDFIVKKEGEETFLELVDAIEGHENLKKVKGITYRNNQKIISNPDRPLIKDLDALPFPDRNLLESEYMSEINGIIFSKRFTSILSSRGCPFSCSFCCCSTFLSRFWRPRSPENVVDELELIESQEYDQVVFVDDNLTLDKKRTIKICRLIRERKIKLDWFCEGRVDQASSEMFYHMKKAGCKVVYLGIESANERILRYYDKKIVPSQSIKAVKNAKKAGINVIGTFIVGAPTESEQEIWNTIKFAQRLGIDFPQFNILVAASGMPIWNEMKDKGYINEDECWEDFIYIPDVSPDCVPIERIRKIINGGYRRFLRRWNFISEQFVKTITNPFRMSILFKNINNKNLLNVSKIYKSL